MAKPHWFPLYVPDFLSSPTVTMMNAEEVGGYILLLCYAWQDPKGSLPADDDSLRVLSRVKGDMTRLKSCFSEKNGRLYNARLTKELEKVHDKSLLAKQSASMRWHSEGNATALRRQCSSQSQSQKNKKKSMPLRADVEGKWLDELKKNPAYQHINFLVEFGKMDAWFSLPKNKHRHRTRAFVLNWINKIEAPVTGHVSSDDPTLCTQCNPPKHIPVEQRKTHDYVHHPKWQG